MDVRIILYETSTQIFRVGVEDARIEILNQRVIIASVLEAAASSELMEIISVNVSPGQHTIQRNIHLAEFLIQSINHVKRRKRLERGKAQKNKDFMLRIRNRRIKRSKIRILNNVIRIKRRKIRNLTTLARRKKKLIRLENRKGRKRTIKLERKRRKRIQRLMRIYKLMRRNRKRLKTLKRGKTHRSFTAMIRIHSIRF